MTAPDSTTQELLALNQQLLNSIAAADWQTYQSLCDPTLTALEPEALGHLVEGMAFHQFYFALGSVPGHHNTTMSSPHVRVLGDVAIVCYVRLTQMIQGDQPVTAGCEETRVWQRQEGGWKHVHFHRSRLP
jgi:ketosteroid isomerase-like protein